MSGWLVELLVQRMDSFSSNVPLDVTDSLGRTPLHVAAACGSTEAICAFTNGYSPKFFVTAPLIQDERQRCPLHWACTHPKHRASRREKFLSKLACAKTNDACLLYAVRVLINAYPEATLIRDRDGKAPLDLAVESKADPRIVALVDEATLAARRRQQKHGFWDSQYGSMDLTEMESSFPSGFPGEISVRTERTLVCTERRFNYAVFEC